LGEVIDIVNCVKVLLKFDVSQRKLSAIIF
jgi:hypothetical protein